MHTLRAGKLGFVENLCKSTYGAVAGIVGGNHRTLMEREPRNHRDSLVVNKRTRLPTVYEAAEKQPAFATSIDLNGVIYTPEDLDEWLAGHNMGDED